MVALVQENPQVQVKTPVDRIIEQIAEQSGQSLDAERLRIQLGRRIQYGELASGEQRDRLDEAEASSVLAAIKEPATPGVDAEDYEGGVANIRISVGDPDVGYETLFSQERDGVISTNHFQLEQQAQSESTTANLQVEDIDSRSYELAGDRLVETSVAEAAIQGAPAQPTVDPVESAGAAIKPDAVASEISPSTNELPGDDLVTGVVRDQEMVYLIPAMVDPLGAGAPSVSELGGYQIEVDGRNATVSTGGTVLLQVSDGKVSQSALPERDAKALQTLLQRSSAESWTVPVQTPDPNLMAKEPHPAIALAQQQIEALPEGRPKQFFQKLGEDLGAQVDRAAQSVRQGLESEQFKALQQKAVAAAQAAPEKSAEVIGRGLEQTGQWVASRPEAIQNAAAAIRAASEKSAKRVGGALEKAGQWLASRPETIREQRAAKTALALFAKGFNRTQESSYEHGGMKVAVAGGNELSLSDAKTGNALMRFKVESSPTPGQPKLTVTEKNISPEQYRALDAVAKSGETVRGSAEGEAQHAQKSERFAQFSKTIASAMGSADCETKHYRIEVGDDSLKISDSKSGREVYRQDGDQVESRLGQKDFERVDQALSKLEQSAVEATVLQPKQAVIG